jgi:hypothetical protein
MVPDGARFVLDEGSKYYGRAYRVAMVPAGTTGHHEAPGIRAAGYIGMTKREAYDALGYIAAAIEDTVHALITRCPEAVYVVPESAITIAPDPFATDDDGGHR